VIDLRGVTSKGQRQLIDRAMMVAAVIHPMTALPQVFQIYLTRSAQDVSLITWLSFMLLGVIFLVYALLHRIRPMIVTQILWFVVDLLVVVGVLLYG
jgi:uncharacterized protein with PQ loop repeat